MKSKLIMSVLIIVFLFPAAVEGIRGLGDMNVGLYLSLGQMRYNFKTFTGSGIPAIDGRPKDLIVGFSLSYKNQVELNLIYNRTTGDIAIGDRQYTYDKDGFGIELGKVIPIHLFEKSGFDVSTEFAAGGFVVTASNKSIYAFKDGLYLEGDKSEVGDSHYQVGIYWAVRLKTLISKKASVYLGMKSLLPFKSNEFYIDEDNKVLLYKSYLYLGISF